MNDNQFQTTFHGLTIVGNYFGHVSPKLDQPIGALVLRREPFQVERKAIPGDQVEWDNRDAENPDYRIENTIYLGISIDPRAGDSKQYFAQGMAGTKSEVPSVWNYKEMEERLWVLTPMKPDTFKPKPKDPAFIDPRYFPRQP
jgi:hypothetical protein